jgi:hypothetical protein
MIGTIPGESSAFEQGFNEELRVKLSRGGVKRHTDKDVKLNP